MSRKVRRPKTVIPTQQSYDLDEVLGGRGGGGGFGQRDELDDAMRDARRMQADKLKRSIVEKTQLELDKEIMDMKRGMGSGGGGGGSPTLAPEELSYLTNLPEEQRGTAIQALAMFKGQSGGGNATGSLGPLLVMSMLRDKPQAGVGEMVTALKGLNDIIQTGKPPANNIDSVVSIARLLLEFKDKDQTNVTDLYKRLLDERSGDPLQQTETVINLAKALGMSPSGGQHPEVERMKIDHETAMQKSDQEFQLLIRKMEKDDKRMETLVNMLTDVLKPFAANAGAALPGLLGGAVGGAAGASMVRPQAQTPSAGGPLSVKCPNPQCSYEPIWVSEDTPVGICPQCGQSVTHPKFKDRVGAQPPGGGAPPPPSSGSDSSMPPPPR